MAYSNFLKESVQQSIQRHVEGLKSTLLKDSASNPILLNESVLYPVLETDSVQSPLLSHETAWDFDVERGVHQKSFRHFESVDEEASMSSH